MTEQEQIEKNLSEAFHLMYDGLPRARAALPQDISRCRGQSGGGGVRTRAGPGMRARVPWAESRFVPSGADAQGGHHDMALYGKDGEHSPHDNLLDPSRRTAGLLRPLRHRRYDRLFRTPHRGLMPKPLNVPAAWRCPRRKQPKEKFNRA